jgi:ribose transport system substrate-binding protein
MAEVADAAMAVGNEMLDGGASADVVVGQHLIGIEHAGDTIDNNHRGASFPLGDEVALIIARRHEYETVDAPRHQSPGQLSLADVVFVDTACNDNHPATQGNVLDRPIEGGREWVRYVVNQKTNRHALAVGTAQVAGGDIRPKVELLYCSLYTVDQRLRNADLAVDNPGNGLDANASKRGDVTHRGAGSGRNLGAVPELHADEDTTNVPADNVVGFPIERLGTSSGLRYKGVSEVLDTTRSVGRSILDNVIRGLVPESLSLQGGENMISSSARGSRRALLLTGGATALLLAACGSSTKPAATTAKAADAPKAATTAAPAAAGKKLKIAFVMGAESDPFFQAMKVGAEEEAKAKNVELIWQGDPKEYSPATQIPVVDQVLALKPDGLVLIPTDPKALQASVAKAKAAGVAVSMVDTKTDDLTDVVSFITGDNQDGGSQAADAMAKAMGYKDGTTYEVVIGLTSDTATTNVGRRDGFKKQIAAKYPGIKVVDEAFSQSKPDVANTNVNNWLTKFPNLKGIFAIDGSNADGAAAAIQAKGLVGKVVLVGYDAYPKNIPLVKSGVITALIAQVPAAEAKQAIDDLVQVITTKKADGIKKEVVLPNFTITKDTTEADLKKYTYVG